MLINVIDLVALAAVLSFAALGASRGLVDQICRIIPSWGTLALMMTTQSFWTPVLSPFLPKNYQSTGAMVVAGLAAYPLAKIFVRFFIWRLAGTILGRFDRLGGAFLGAIQGILIVSLGIFVLWLGPVSNDKSFQKSQCAKIIYPYVQKISKEYLWVALKTQPRSLADQAVSYWKI